MAIPPNNKLLGILATRFMKKLLSKQSASFIDGSAKKVLIIIIKPFVHLFVIILILIALGITAIYEGFGYLKSRRLK